LTDEQYNALVTKWSLIGKRDGLEGNEPYTCGDLLADDRRLWRDGNPQVLAERLLGYYMVAYNAAASYAALAHRPGEPFEAEADGMGESRLPRFGGKR